MNAIIEMNTLSHAWCGWQTRLAEVRAADSDGAKFLAWHHFLQALDREIPSIREALATYESFVRMSNAERRAVGRKGARDIEKAVFRCFIIMDRVEPGIAAVEKLAGGDLPRDLRNLRQQIWRTLEKADVVQQNFYSGYCPDLSDAIRLLCDELENHIIAFYTVAKGLYNLPELDGRIQ
jgi:hypothetical protein